jgi:diguanylate cyclase (GGDEF)-like protein
MVGFITATNCAAVVPDKPVKSLLNNYNKPVLLSTGLFFDLFFNLPIKTLLQRLLMNYMEYKTLLLKNILNNIGLSIFWKDKHRRFLGANKSFLDYYNFTIDDILGKTDEDMNWHIDPEPFKREEEKVINEGYYVNNLQGNCIINGQMRYIIASKFPLYDEDNNIVGLWGYFRDNTEEIMKINNLSNEAMTDSLTKLSNRRGLDNELLNYEKSYKDNHIDFVLYFFDIDKFKIFNDTYGHDLGDIVLTSVSSGLLKSFNNSAIIARQGGDEFIVVKQYKDEKDINIYQNMIQSTFDSISIVNHPDIRVNCSIGHAVYSEVNSLDKLIKLADYRMYEIKRERNINTKNP